MRFLKYTLLFIFVFTFAETTFADKKKPVEDKPPVFKVEDKYNEVILCLTKSSVYMQFDNAVKEYINQEIAYRHNIEESRFIDSEGHFLLEDMILLSSDKLEYSFSDIEKVTFEEGVLTFTYNNRKSFTFSDILSTDGNPALQNFYVEDLENFYMNYKKLAP
ncbi:MAG: hypothetical protein ABJH08_00905 [Balneola sp.]